MDRKNIGLYGIIRIVLYVAICVAVYGVKIYHRGSDLMERTNESINEYFVDPNIEKSGLIYNIPWGTDKDKVRKILKERTGIEPSEASEDKLVISGKNYDAMEGVDIDFGAFFDDDKLYMFVIDIYENTHTGYDIFTLKDKYKRKLDEVYGSPKSEQDNHFYEWPSANGAVSLKVWDDEEDINQIGLIFSDSFVRITSED